MPERLVINTSPILALIAACGSLDLLQGLYSEVLVPHEVCEEIAAGGRTGFGIAEFLRDSWLRKWAEPVQPGPLLRNAMDKGEAAVIQLALDQSVPKVCIDEPVARRLARLNGLTVTGSIGILLRAHAEGKISSVREAIDRMQAQGIWISESVIAFALHTSGEE